MSTCYHPFRNIAYVHTPRCAGTNISRTLICNNDFIDGSNYIVNQHYRIEKIIIF